LKDYPWPGNVRELKRVCEQLSLTSPLPMIREEEVRSLLRPSLKSAVATGTIDFHLGLSALLQNFEKTVLTQALLQFQKDIDRSAQALQVSRSNLYKKIKDYDIDLEKI